LIVQDFEESQSLPSGSRPTPTPADTDGLDSVGALSKGFWDNKGAVGGVFAFVGLVIVTGAAFMVWRYLRSRRQSREIRFQDDMFGEKYGGVDENTTPTLSLRGTPINPFPDRDFGARFQGAVVTSHYPFEGTRSPALPVFPARTSPTSYNYDARGSPKPPRSAQSHESHQSIRWAANASQQSHSSQRASPSRQQTQANANPFEDPINYAAATNTDYYGMRGATPSSENHSAAHGLMPDYDAAYGGVAIEYAPPVVAHSRTPTPTKASYSVPASPTKARALDRRDSVDSFYGSFRSKQRGQRR